MNFNEKLISLRRSKGLSQEQLANLVNVSRQAVSKWETAESQPEFNKLILLSDVLGVSVDELCCNNEKEEKEKLPMDQQISRSNSWWISGIALIIGFIIGIPGGIFAAGYFFPKPTQEKIDRLTITSCNITIELHNNKMQLAFSPSLSKTSGKYSVIKIDSSGKTKSFPATYTDGIYRSEIDIYKYQDDFTINAVYIDGINEYTTALVKISDIFLNSYTIDELWKK